MTVILSVYLPVCVLGHLSDRPSVPLSACLYACLVPWDTVRRFNCLIENVYDWAMCRVLIKLVLHFVLAMGYHVPPHHPTPSPSPLHSRLSPDTSRPLTGNGILIKDDAVWYACVFVWVCLLSLRVNMNKHLYGAPFRWPLWRAVCVPYGWQSKICGNSNFIWTSFRHNPRVLAIYNNNNLRF